MVNFLKTPLSLLISHSPKILFFKPPPPHGFEYDVTSGLFLFHDNEFGIDFDYQHGILKMIWKAKKYTHCAPFY
ncbi:hypothetical protein VP01_4210g2 [Puccinia sorghi]|uniref:Tet-like 2OG-Fe(II) oxygenase domain-containing protein n=1 Tax=Puccinia sorghi TaxID=27349 RepID=A0A0L6UQP5_9BASI|nr:hypothetical protein VP01_4210g2 [Puccinia sorghi]